MIKTVNKKNEVVRGTEMIDFNLDKNKLSLFEEYIPQKHDPNIWVPTIDYLYQYVQSAEFDENGMHVINDNGMHVINDNRSIYEKTQFYLKSTDDRMIHVYKRNAYTERCYNIFSFTFSVSLIREELSGMVIVSSSSNDVYTLDKEMELRDITEYFSGLRNPVISEFFGYIYPIIFNEIN